MKYFLIIIFNCHLSVALSNNSNSAGTQNSANTTFAKKKLAKKAPNAYFRSKGFKDGLRRIFSPPPDELNYSKKHKQDMYYCDKDSECIAVSCQFCNPYHSIVNRANISRWYRQIGKCDPIDRFGQSCPAVISEVPELKCLERQCVVVEIRGAPFGQAIHLRDRENIDKMLHQNHSIHDQKAHESRLNEFLRSAISSLNVKKDVHEEVPRKATYAYEPISCPNNEGKQLPWEDEQIAIIKWLLSLGADPSDTSNGAPTPVYLAKKLFIRNLLKASGGQMTKAENLLVAIEQSDLPKIKFFMSDQETHTQPVQTLLISPLDYAMKLTFSKDELKGKCKSNYEITEYLARIFKPPEDLSISLNVTEDTFLEVLKQGYPAVASYLLQHHRKTGSENFEEFLLNYIINIFSEERSHYNPALRDEQYLVFKNYWDARTKGGFNNERQIIRQMVLKRYFEGGDKSASAILRLGFSINDSEQTQLSVSATSMINNKSSFSEKESERFRRLLNIGAFRFHNQESPLSAAINHHNHDALRIILEGPKSVQTTMGQECPPLIIARRANNIIAYFLLRRHGDHVGVVRSHFPQCGTGDGTVSKFVTGVYHDILATYHQYLSMLFHVIGD